VLREFSIIATILIIIIGGNILMQQYLVKSSEPIIQNLEQLYEKITQTNNINKEEIKSIIENVEQQWEQVGKIWTMIITHSELDQIEIALLNTKTAVEVDKLEEASIELKKSMFLLNHIQEKDAFKIKNIF